MTDQRAILRNIHIAPRKVRLVADRLRGLPVSTAIAELMFSRERSASALLKLIRSAVADATHNQSADPARLYIKTIAVDGGPVLKRYMPRARGAASPIMKRTSTITVFLSASEKIKPVFTIIPPAKKTKIKKEKKEESSAPASSKSKSKPAIAVVEKEKSEGERKGVFRKFFRRKSI